MKRILILFIALTLYGCYQVNSETSEIGSMSPSCLDSLAWKKICQKYSTDSITDPNLISRLEDVRNHFIKPDYILYFDEEPKEIIGCSWYSIRVVYNEKIADQLLTGLSQFLSNKEQKRVRNRVFAELMKYQCEDGKSEMIKAMKMKVPFAKSHKDYPLKSSSQEDFLESELNVYKDLETGIKKAKIENKPILVYFTGYALPLRDKVKSDILLKNETTLNLLKNSYINIWLYIDDKDNGQKWFEYQKNNFKYIAQPYFCVLNSNGTIISGGLDYESAYKRLERELKKHI